MLATAAISPSIIDKMAYPSPTQTTHYTPMLLQQAQAQAALQQQQQLRQQQSHEYFYQPPAGLLVYQSPTAPGRTAPLGPLVHQEPLEYRMQPPRPQSQPVFPGQSPVQPYQQEQLYHTAPQAQVNPGYGFRFPPEVGPYEMPTYAPAYAVDNFANASAGPSEYRGWGEDEEHQEYAENGDLSYNPTEVKHRRRTTPEQFRVLEESFMQNPKPTNQHRKVLADMLGMTTRGVQVWFQNRRAKAKATVKKEMEAQRTMLEEQANGRANPSPLDPVPASQLYDPRYHGQDAQQPTVLNGSLFIPPPSLGAVGRRVSLGAIQERPTYDDYSPRKVSQSPALGSAAEARRGSLPYPSPLTMAPQRQAQALGPVPSSPSSRHLPLHLLGMRAGRRASLPNGAMTVSSGPFTPPRVGNIHPLPARSQTTGMIPGRISPPSKRELSPIEDHEQTVDGAEGSHRPRPLTVKTAVSYNGSLQTPLSGNYSQSASPFDTFSPEGVDTLSHSQYSTSQGPLPNPTFSFGSAMPASAEQPLPANEPAYPVDPGPLYDFTKARFGSIASIDTTQTDATENGSGSEWGITPDWVNQVSLSQIFEDGSVDSFSAAATNPGFMTVPQGFHPDARRASAPADLLHNFAFLGMAAHHRPSPLNQGYSMTKVNVNEPLNYDNLVDASTGPSPVEVQINGVSADSYTADSSPEQSSGIPTTYLSPVNSDLAPSPLSAVSAHSAHSAGSQATLGSQVDQLSMNGTVDGDHDQWDQPDNVASRAIFEHTRHGLFDP